MIFTNRFFSKQGQKERLINTFQTVKAAVTGKGVVANTSSRTANKVLSFAASNPFTTAAVVTPINTISAAKAAYTALPTAAKAVTVPTAVVATGYVVSNPSSIQKLAEAPKQLSEFGSDLGALSKNPSIQNAKQVFKNSPVISSAIALGGAAVIGSAATGTIATIANTRALKENTQKTLIETIPQPSGSELPAAPVTTINSLAGSSEPITRQTQVLGREPRSRKLTKRKIKTIEPIRNSVRVNIINQNNYKPRRT